MAARRKRRVSRAPGTRARRKSAKKAKGDLLKTIAMLMLGAVAVEFKRFTLGSFEAEAF